MIPSWSNIKQKILAIKSPYGIAKDLPYYYDLHMFVSNIYDNRNTMKRKLNKYHHELSALSCQLSDPMSIYFIGGSFARCCSKFSFAAALWHFYDSVQYKEDKSLFIQQRTGEGERNLHIPTVIRLKLSRQPKFSVRNKKWWRFFVAFACTFPWFPQTFLLKDLMNEVPSSLYSIVSAYDIYINMKLFLILEGLQLAENETSKKQDCAF